MSGGLESLSDAQLQELKAAGGDVTKLSDATLQALQSAQKPPTQTPLDKAWTGINTGVNWAGTRAVNAATGLPQIPTTLEHLARNAAEGVTGQRLPPKAAPDPWDTAAVGAQLFKKWFFDRAPAVDTPGRLGKVLDASTEALLGGLVFPGGGALRGMMIPNAIGGATGEIAGQATEGSKLEPYARLFGSTFGTLLPSVPQMMRATGPAMVARRTSDMTPADWDAAKAFQAEAGQRGVPLMAHEAMTADRMSPMAQLFGDVAASPGGAPIRKFATERAQPGGAIASAIDRQADTLAPKIVDPKAVDMALAKAADEAVRAPKQARSQAANDAYAAGKQDFVPAGDLSRIVDNIDEALKNVQTLPQGQAAGALRKLRGMLVKGENEKTVTYQGNVGALDEALKELKHVIEARAFDGKPLVPDTVRVKVQPLLGDLRSALIAASPDYARGHAIYAGGPWGPSPHTAAVNAAEQSGAGQIAAAYGGKPDQARGLFGKWVMDPENARPATVRADIARLNAQDPNAARAALRLYVENIGDAAFQRTQAGANIEAGSKFTKAIAGKPNQRANLMAAVEAVTGNATTAAGFSKLIDILDRTGVTPNIGSPTATRGMTAAEASTGALTPVFETANIGRGSIMGWLGDKYSKLRFGKVYGELADLTTHPDGVRKLHELAMLNPESARARALVQSLVQGALSPQRGSVTP